jgi:hypothetical protein
VLIYILYAGKETNTNQSIRFFKPTLEQYKKMEVIKFFYTTALRIAGNKTYFDIQGLSELSLLLIRIVCGEPA